MRATRRWSILLLLVMLAAGCASGSDGEETGGGQATTAPSPAPAGGGAEGSLGDATFAAPDQEEEILAGEVPMTPESTSAAGGRPLPRCADDTLTVTTENRSRAEAATVCIINKIRRRRGTRALKNNAQLYDAAQKHANDMVQRKYFSHVSQGGTGSTARIKSTGYMSGADRWQVGENIAWGTGSYSTPAAIVQSWMNSPGHRQNILRRTYREAGLAIAVGAPAKTRADAGTYAHAFGRR
jgi:uncharacterized protein YkwD